MTPCSFKFSRMSLSLQCRCSRQRMTPLEELRELCNDILTLRSNILVVFSRFSTCCFLSTSNSRSPDFSFLIFFGWPTIDWILFSMTKENRSAMVRFSSCDFTTKKRGTFKSVDEVGCWVSGSELEDSHDSPVDCLPFLTLWGDGFFMIPHNVHWLKFVSCALRPPRSPTREHQNGVACQLTGVRDTLRYTRTNRMPTRLTR